MKQRGIWIAICLILIIGSSFTGYVRRYTGGSGEKALLESGISDRQDNDITSREAGILTPETEKVLPGNPAAREKIAPFSLSALEMDESGAESETGKERSVQSQSPAPLAADAFVATASDIGPQKQAASYAGAARDVSPAAAGDIMKAGDNQEANMAVAEEAGQDSVNNSALTRLLELDNQIARNRAKETDWTASAKKNSAESEWKLWETEIQRMLGILKEHLDDQQQEALMQQQRDWMRSREEQAVDASKKQRGTSMEEIHYSRSLTELTRARAYELAEIYGEYFQESKKP